MRSDVYATVKRLLSYTINFGLLLSVTSYSA